MTTLKTATAKAEKAAATAKRWQETVQQRQETLNRLKIEREGQVARSLEAAKEATTDGDITAEIQRLRELELRGREAELLLEGAEARLKEAEADAAAADLEVRWLRARDVLAVHVDAAKAVDDLARKLAAALLAWHKTAADFHQALPETQNMAPLTPGLAWGHVNARVGSETLGKFGGTGVYGYAPEQYKEMPGLVGEAEGLEWLFPAAKQKAA